MVKLLIISDMEGCAGVVKENQLHGLDTPVREAGQIMCRELNAAVEAACDAGMDDIVVFMGHTAPEEIQWDLLDQRPQYLIGADILEVLDSDFAGIGFVGQHAMAGSGGVLEHSFDMKNYHRVLLNDNEVGETGFIAAVGGDFDVPVLFLSGDDVCCREIEALVPGVANAAVKTAISRNGALTRHPAAAADLIRKAVSKGIKNRDSLKPWKIESPVEMEIAYNWMGPVERNTLVPGVERAGDRSIRYTCDSITEAYRMFGLLARIV